MTRQSSFGICELCGARKGKAAMTAHLRQCLPLTRNGRGSVPGVLLRVQSGGLFWLHVAAGRNATLSEIDDLLRNVWLECCGHLSEFYGTGRREFTMNTRVLEVFRSVGDRIRYLYDFGSSTELEVGFAGFAEGIPRKPVVAARNEPLVWPCDVCGQPASSLCSDCQYSGGGFFCATHAQNHECGEEMLLPTVNSPRMGVCGYTG